MKTKNDMEKKLTYIAHPISGDVVGNLTKIMGIIREININEPDVVPIASYFADLLSMDDENPRERERGLNNALELIKTGIFRELRLYGDTISSGMLDEIKVARKAGTAIKPMTPATDDEYFEMTYGYNLGLPAHDEIDIVAQ